jgi:hypothetical protein
MRHEGFFCNLDVLYEGPGKSKLQFLKKKIFIFFPLIFGHQNLDLDPDSMNMDPQLCVERVMKYSTVAMINAVLFLSKHVHCT